MLVRVRGAGVVRAAACGRSRAAIAGNGRLGVSSKVHGKSSVWALGLCYGTLQVTITVHRQNWGGVAGSALCKEKRTVIVKLFLFLFMLSNPPVTEERPQSSPRCGSRKDFCLFTPLIHCNKLFQREPKSPDPPTVLLFFSISCSR